MHFKSFTYAVPAIHLYNLQYCLTSTINWICIISILWNKATHWPLTSMKFVLGYAHWNRTRLFFSSVERLASALVPSWSDLFIAPRLTLSSHRMAGKGSQVTWRLPLAWSLQGVLALLAVLVVFFLFFFNIWKDRWKLFQTKNTWDWLLQSWEPDILLFFQTFLLALAEAPTINCSWRFPSNTRGLTPLMCSKGCVKIHAFEVERVRYNYVCRYVCCGPKSVGGFTWPKHMHAQSLFCKVKS